MKRGVFGLVAAMVCAAVTAEERYPNFAERFAFGGTNRTRLAAEYMPGTEEGYFYQTLDAQNRGALDEARQFLSAWDRLEKRNAGGRTVEPMWLRQTFLQYAQNPTQTLHTLVQRFNVQLKWPRPGAPQAGYSSVLDPRLISEERFFQWNVTDSDISSVKDVGLARLAASPTLTIAQQNNLLQRIPQMEGADAIGVMPKLLEAIRRSDRHFSVLSILPFLTTDELEQVRALRPTLMTGEPYVNAYLRTLMPSADVDWEMNVTARRAYLERIYAFGLSLPEIHQGLTARALYAILDLDRQRGIYDRERFKRYLAFPVRTERMNPEFLQMPQALAAGHVHWNERYEYAPLLNGGQNDEALVTDYLEHFLIDAASPDEFATWLRSDYLSRLFASIKLMTSQATDAAVYGRGLTPQDYQRLKDRVELVWLPTNPRVLAAEADVGLDLRVKNVGSVRVAIYDLDGAEVCKAVGGVIQNTLSLSGAEPTATRVLDCSQVPPLRRQTLHLDFPELKKPGVYVVECSGNGACTRAVIRKGQLFATSRIGSAGIAVTVRGEDGMVQRAATLRLGDRLFTAGSDGEIVVPFATARQEHDAKAVIACGRLAAPFTFRHELEAYRLHLWTLLEQENLLPDQLAEAILHPSLEGPGGVRVSLALVERPVLEVTLTDTDGVKSVERVTTLKLSDTDALVYRFRVPPRACRAEFTLSGEVRVLSRGRTETLQASDSFGFADHGRGRSVADAFLRHTAEGYQVELRGRTGEGISNRVVSLRLESRFYRRPIELSLQSDVNGFLHLGPLTDIETLNLQAGGDPAVQISRTWKLDPSVETVRLPATMSGAVGATFTLPAYGANPHALRDTLSLLAVNAAGAFTQDALTHISILNDTLYIAELPPGDYRLLYRERGEQVRLRVTAVQQPDETLLVGAHRVLESAGPDVLRIDAMKVEQGKVHLHVAGASADTRVHLVARRMMNERGDSRPFVEKGLDVWTRPVLHSAYLNSRELGDEERYVMERRAAGGQVGVALPRPSALVTPWSREETSTRELKLKSAESFTDEPSSAALAVADRMAPRELSDRDWDGQNRAGSESPSLEFLPEPAVLVANLRPDEKGNLAVPDTFGNRQELVAYAIDGSALAVRRLAVAGKPILFTARDLRFTTPLPEDHAFTQQVLATGLVAGATLSLPHGNGITWRAYPTLGAVQKLFQALRGDATFDEFRFVAEWPTFTPERRRELYGQYACHELNFFLYCKDRAFFDAVVKPNLANKRVKRFLDVWLLGGDVTPWREPAAYAKLNAFEKALLARRLDSPERAAIAREFADRCRRLPRDPAGDEHRLAIALRNGAEVAMPSSAVAIADDSKAAEKPFLFEAIQAVRSPVLMKNINGACAASVGSRREKTKESTFRKDVAKRAAVQQLYRPPERTREWIESYYWKTAAADEHPDRIPVNRFWRDFVGADVHAARGDGTNGLDWVAPAESILDAAMGGFTERMAALAVLNVGFEGQTPEAVVDGDRLVIRAVSPALFFLRETVETREVKNPDHLALVERFFNCYAEKMKDGKPVVSYERDEFLKGTVYDSQIVVMNPSPVEHYVRILRQIPQGALPLDGKAATESVPLLLAPYETRKLMGGAFYFPFAMAAPAPHYAARLSAEGGVLSRGEALAFHVVAASMREDRSSWAYVADKGSAAAVLDFLTTQNLYDRTIDLRRIAWRMDDRSFFDSVLGILESRGIYCRELWGFALKYNQAKRIRQLLCACGATEMCGKALASPLLTVEPERDGLFEHAEYWPLINTRSQAVGGGTFIANESLAKRYRDFLDTLAYQPRLTADDELLATVYLLMQDRVADARAHFKQVKRDEVAAKMQVDYTAAWLAFAEGRVNEAVAMAQPYADYPVPLWRDRFREVLSEAAEIRGDHPAVHDPDSREETQHQLAMESPMLTLTAENEHELHLVAHQVAACELRFHPVDLELLFSQNPFMERAVGGDFAKVRPIFTQLVKFGRVDAEERVALPAALRTKNLLVAAVGDGGRAQARVLVTPNVFHAQLSPNYGRVRVTARLGGKPLGGVYVKVYARGAGGQVRYHKDGYTDWRGVFDYASISTDSAFEPKTFAILLVAPDGGTEILTANKN